jgi:hypothetical protein
VLTSFWRTRAQLDDLLQTDSGDTAWSISGRRLLMASPRLCDLPAVDAELFEKLPEVDDLKSQSWFSSTKRICCSMTCRQLFAKLNRSPLIRSKGVEYIS